jgi:hypothetical protein
MENRDPVPDGLECDSEVFPQRGDGEEIPVPSGKGFGESVERYQREEGYAKLPAHQAVAPPPLPVTRKE